MHRQVLRLAAKLGPCRPVADWTERTFYVPLYSQSLISF